jgi:hypothetical protein
MSVVILGGNECMVRKYKELCEEYQCRAKVFAKPVGSLKNKLGCPDLMVCFTSTMSHKMLRSAMTELKGKDTVIAHCPTSSISALRGVLEQHAV